MTRRPAVAGMFYEAGKEDLVRSLERCFIGEFGPGALPEAHGEGQHRICGLVCPHAGYMYSGPAAAWAYAELAKDGLPDTVVILGPNHHGLGAGVAVSTDEAWQTPLGDVQLDLDTANTILQLSDYAQPDSLAHIREHSIEVQLPFLQYIAGDRIKIVPIALSHFVLEDALALSADLGSAIAGATAGKIATVIASTDFSHYETRERANAQDALAIDRILNLDGPGLLRVVERQSITMCGATGVAAMLEACKLKGAKTATRLTYYTSGDIVGDMEQVVGYAALSVES